MAGTRTMGTTLTMKKAGDEPDDTVIAHLTSIGEVNGEREEIDVTTLTPIEAMNKLYELQKLL